jgi:hypothetical protein
MKKFKNITYIVEEAQLKQNTDVIGYAQYRFNDGYLVLYWIDEHKVKNYHGFITTIELKKLLGNVQWSKFCQGKREFTIRREIKQF